MDFLGGQKNPEMVESCSVDVDKLLEGLEHIEIAEKLSGIEVLSSMAGAGIEMPNTYRVLNDGKLIFFVLETSSCIVRQLKSCLGDCAPWDVEMRVINESGEAEPAYKLERPWTCTFCCFMRPVVTIHDVREEHDEEIGSVVDPFNCCDLTFTVKDGEGEEAMMVKGGCCQPGLCCPLPCGPCSEIHFDAEDMEGNHIGSMSKKLPSCLHGLFAGDVDHFQVTFEGDEGHTFEDPKMKVLMMAVAVFMDFRYFSSTN